MNFHLLNRKPLILLFTLSLLIFIAQTTDTDVESNSLILTTGNFDSEISSNDYLLVNFYALWCKYSKQLKPEWVELSNALRTENSPVKLAMVEAYDEKALAEKYKIDGFPTIKLFIKGQPYDYNCGNHADHILEFVHRKLNAPLTNIPDQGQIKEKLTEYEWVGVLIGGADDQENIIKGVANKVDDVLFVKSTSEAFSNQYPEGSFVLMNNVTNSADAYSGDFNDDGIVTFIKEKKFPSVARFGKGSAEKIFLNDDPAMILFKKSDDKGAAAEDAFQKAAAQIQSQIFFTVASYEEETGRLLAENLGIAESELPTVRIVKPGDDRILKYYLDGEITADSIVKFNDDYSKNTAKRFYLSEAVPEQNNDLVKKVVSKTFEEIVLDASKDVLLLIWTPWCSHCIAMQPIYDNVARKMHEVSDFTVAKINAVENDLEGFGLDVLDFPTILLFTKTGKNLPVEMEGAERDEYAFDKFIRAHATVALNKMKGPNPFDKNEL